MFEKSENLSYRAKWRTECLRTLCGFANAWGGTLYIGVDENGELTGLSQEYCDFVLSEIPDTIRNTLHIIPEFALLEEGGLRYISIKVGVAYVPVSYNGEYYVRRKTVNQKLSGKDAEELLIGRGGATWDTLWVYSMCDRDLDSKAIAAYRLTADKGAEPCRDAEYMESLHLKTEGRYTHAAALMFTEHPEYLVREAYAKVGFFDGDGNVLHQEKATGPLNVQAWTALQAVLSRYMRLYRKVLPLPEDALKEALLNAVVHKDYSKAQPIQVRVTKDRVRIINTGGLPAGWNPDTLMGEHVSEPRNPLIAELFARAGYTDSWGMGVERMCKACMKAGLPAPAYSVSGFGFSVEFSLKKAA
ncbi:MAG: putative DNA binding domain-containing protein [Clostridia bacterium]|nr:putative DNA binding domain-containing protein [Clostridia bacterium]